MDNPFFVAALVILVLLAILALLGIHVHIS